MNTTRFPIALLALLLSFSACDDALVQKDLTPRSALDTSDDLTGDASEGVSSVVFWSEPKTKDADKYIVLTNIENRLQYEAVITGSFLEKSGPDCDECRSCAHFQVPAGTYSYQALNAKGFPVVDGRNLVTLAPDGCQSVLIKPKEIISTDRDISLGGK